MNQTIARCGHPVIAVGAPGSLARQAVEGRHCGLPRCESGLPKKFTDRECAAFVWLRHRGFKNWSVDMVSKDCRMEKGDRYVTFINLCSAATYHGWEG